MAAAQANVDKIIREYFEKQAEMEKVVEQEDSAPQPFSQFVLVQYFLEEFNSSHDENMSEKEKNRHAKQIALTVKTIMGMTTGEAKSFFHQLDARRVEAIRKRNARVVFDFCLIREMSAMKNLVGEEREKFRKARVAAYEAGTFDYPLEARRSEEILISVEDLHFPDGSKKLQPIDYSSTYDKLLEKQKAKKKLERNPF